MSTPNTGKPRLSGLAKEQLELLEQCLTFTNGLLKETLLAYCDAVGIDPATAQELVSPGIEDSPSSRLPSTELLEQWQLSDIQEEVSYWCTGWADIVATRAEKASSKDTPLMMPPLSRELRRAKADVLSALSKAKLRLDMKREQLGERAKFTSEDVSRAIKSLENLPQAIDLRSTECVLRSLPGLSALLMVLAAPTAQVDRESILDAEWSEELPMGFLCLVLSGDSEPIDNDTFRKRVANGTYTVHRDYIQDGRRKLRIWLEDLPSNLRRNKKDRDEAVARFKAASKAKRNQSGNR